MSKYDTYFVDLDGTIYQGTIPIPAGKRFIERLKGAGKQLLLLTNNSTRTPQEVVDFLAKYHDIKVDVSEVYTSALATADYVASISNGKQRVHIIGEWGLHKAFLERGFYITTHHPDFVVVGMDHNATYADFATAVLNIQAGAQFIGTNPDTNLPSEAGMLPGAGSLIALVQYAVKPQATIIGKPHATIMDMALERVGQTKEQVVMVGDNYHTDIQAGQAVGMATLLVYTGVSHPDEVAKETHQPTHQVMSLDEWEF
ncbi:MAG: TIGR01457 family HAD-type hydrolase [Limosilactobacillus sp.]|nr:TIGR01457 family HAD-type hydrolase [Limosilactobacillus sp.]